MDRGSLAHSALRGFFIGVGIALAGFSLSHALFEARTAQRYVSVKGLAEREVDADLAIWPITFSEAGNDLSELQRSIDAKRETITAFLVEAGFKPGDVSFSAPRILDSQASQNMGDR